MTELAVDLLNIDWRQISHNRSVTDVIQISKDVDLINISVLKKWQHQNLYKFSTE